jgi:hypothetical protein
VASLKITHNIGCEAQDEQRVVLEVLEVLHQQHP